MDILQISEADHGGGAERIAHCLFRSARDAGHRSRMLVAHRRTQDPAVTGVVPQTGPAHFLYRCLASLERRTGVQANLYWMVGAELRKTGARPDILHLHNIHGKFFNLALLPTMARTSGLVFTLHDCWLFTGHCAYVFDCGKWSADCHPCIDIGRYPGMGRDAARLNLKRKERLLGEARPLLVTPSRWLHGLVEKSTALRGLDCRVVYNGIDTERFTPGEKLVARQLLGLPTDRSIILYVVNGGLNSTWYKDPELLLHAVERLLAGPYAGKFHVAVVGGKRKIPELFDGVVSQIDDTRDGLELFYRAADMLVYPTKADNCPLVPMEAMSCELPVVSTRVGGVAEVIEHGVTGYVTAPGDAVEFSEAIAGLLASPSRTRALGAAGRERVKARFTLEAMSASYLQLYEEVREKKRICGTR